MLLRALKNKNADELFMSSVAFMFLLAFWSALVQSEGLAELLPDASSEEMEKLNWFLVCGSFLSAVISVMPQAQCSVAFGALFLMYRYVVRAQRYFTAFQWDILLLETGGIMILYAPILPRFNGPREYVPTAAKLLPRFLAFKLLFMSGVVKVQAGCPTWLGLTATSYHFASQCIPTPLAWWAHALPLSIHKVATGGTLLVEVFCPFFLLFPIVSIRRFGVALQVLFQVSIISTGNYNWFNVLTCVLCMPCWSTDYDVSNPTIRGSRTPLSCFTKCERRSYWLSCAFCISSLFAIWTLIFSGPLSSIELTFGMKRCESFVAIAVPSTIFILFLWLVASSLAFVVHSKSISQGTGRSIWACLALLWFMASAVYMEELYPRSKTSDWPLYHGAQKLAHPTIDLARKMNRAIRGWNIASGYGPFRSMTGVGPAPGIVNRPEVLSKIVMSGRLTALDEWKEIDFRYKPGRVEERPHFVAPFQPRLDWYMWFVALAPPDYIPYQHPWFIALMYKLRKGCEPVVDLLNTELWPYDRITPPPIRVKVDLFHYDFTHSDHNNTQHWWTRKLVLEHVLSIEEDSDELNSLAFLKIHGFSEGCRTPSDSVVGQWVSVIRKRRLFWPLTSMVMLLCAVLVSSFEGQQKKPPHLKQS